jgi:hypothetical protein
MLISITISNHAKTVSRDMEEAIYDLNLERVKGLIKAGNDSVNDEIHHSSLLPYVIEYYASLSKGEKYRPTSPIGFKSSNPTHDAKQIIIFLLENGAPINGTYFARNYHKMTGLHIAVAENLPDIVELLLDHGADTSIEDDEHRTPYAIAVEKKNQKMKEILSQRKTAQGFAKVKGDVTTRHIKK